MAKTKYGHYVKKFSFDHGGAGLYRQVAKISGKSIGLDIHIEYGTHWAAGLMGKEMERHVISEPTAVFIPKGLPHCPLIVTRVDRPFFLTDVRPFGSERFSPGKL